jgi:putative cofactor-binding repeat protein
MNNRRLLVSFALGLGLALSLLWLLSGSPLASNAAAGDVYCVTLGGGSYPACDLVFTNVQAAVDAATGGEEIRVAAGTYTSVQARAGVTQVVYISKTVTIRGGYTTAFTDPPDPETNQVTLDAGGLGRVLYITGTITPVVEGLHITGGSATGLGGTPGGTNAGGGVYVHTATVAINRCVIHDNKGNSAGYGWGGGLYLEFSNGSTLSGNIVRDNIASTVAQGRAGGVYLHQSAATLSGNTVQGNIAGMGGWGEGGGVYVRECSAVLNSNTLQGNTASIDGWGKGGGVYFFESPATLSNNTIQSNTGSTASWAEGGGVHIYNSDYVIVNGNTVRGNIASTATGGKGGGLHFYLSTATVNGNAVISNTGTLSPTASGRGGGVLIEYGGPFTLTNNLVADNHANDAGSGLWFDGSSGNPTSGCLLHTTIADNHSSGQGVGVGDYTTLAFTNTIIAGHHSVGISATLGSTVTLETTMWHDNGASESGGGHVISTTNIYDDPAFADPAVWDYHLTSGSPAIDQGVDAGVTTDIDGSPRLKDPDIGADEYVLHAYLPLVVRSYVP